MNERIYDAIYDKLVRHGYIYLEKVQIPDVLIMVSNEERFGNYAKDKGIIITDSNNDNIVKFEINGWKPYSSNI